MFLFDVLTLGVACFDEGLKAILEDGNILKVMKSLQFLIQSIFFYFVHFYVCYHLDSVVNVFSYTYCT